MAAVQIKELSHTHEAIMQYMLANPGATLAEIGKTFGYTVAWISTMTNSDAFQAQLRARQEQIFNGPVIGTIEDRLRGVAAVGVEKLGKMLENSESPDFVLNATDKVLGRLGYGPKAANVAAPNLVNNTFIVSREELAAARGVIQARQVNSNTVSSEAEVVDVPGDGSLLSPVEPIQGELF